MLISACVKSEDSLREDEHDEALERAFSGLHELAEVVGDLVGDVKRRARRP